MSEFKDGLQTNCTVIHNKVHHGGSNEMNFRMEAVKKFASPMDRQIDEALRIQYSSMEETSGKVVVMNSESEWRSNPIHRAVFPSQRRGEEGGRQTEGGARGGRIQRGGGRRENRVVV